MFSNNDYYHLDDATKTLNDKKLILSLFMEVEALKLLLDKKGIVSPADIEACMTYLKSRPDIKVLTELIEKSENQIREYKSNPEQHLKDLFAAKMNGTIR